jgi:hypothetical protein
LKRALLVLLLAAVTSCAPVTVATRPDTSPSTTVSAPTSEPAPTEPAPSTVPLADPCAALVVCTTADSAKPLNITTPGIYDGRGHKVPSIAITASGVTVQGFVVAGGSQTGISSRGANNVIQDNDVSAIRYGTDDLDAIRFFGDHTRILRNRIHSLASGPIKDAHPDCVQTFATRDKGPSSNVEIGWNTCNPGDTQGHGQCVMAEGPGSTDGGGGATGTSARWNIHDNVCATSANQSISLRDIDDVTVTGNSFTGTNAKAVQLVDGSANVTFSGNVLGAGVGKLSGD